MLPAATPQIPTPPDLYCKLQPFSPPCVGKTAQDVARSAGASILNDIANSFAEAAIGVMKDALTWWIKIPSPTIDASNSTDPVYYMQAHLGWLVTWVAVLGLLIAAGKMAWQRRGEPFREAFSGLITTVLAVFAGAAGVNLAIQAGDGFSGWILNESIRNCSKTQQVSGATYCVPVDAQHNIPVMFSGTLLAGGAALVLVMALLALLSMVIQLGLMLVRGAMLILLAGVLPLAGATAINGAGKAWFRKSCGWLLAFILYKPVAAMIYAVAFYCLQSTDQLVQLQGVFMVILAVVALPALMRFTVPLVSAVGGGGGGGGAAMAAGAAAMGARMVPSLRGGGGGGSDGSSGMPGSRGPKGAQQPGPGGKSGPSSGPGTGPKGPTGSNAANGIGTGSGALQGAVGAGGAMSAAALPLQMGFEGTKKVGEAAKAAADQTIGEGGPTGAG